MDTVGASPDGRLLASGGWDGALLLWRTGPLVVEAAAEAAASAAAAGGPAAKRRKAAAAGAPQAQAVAPEGGLVEAAQARLEGGHVHAVSAVGFATPSLLFSGGWDHSVSVQ